MELNLPQEELLKIVLPLVGVAIGGLISIFGLLFSSRLQDKRSVRELKLKKIEEAVVELKNVEATLDKRHKDMWRKTFQGSDAECMPDLTVLQFTVETHCHEAASSVTDLRMSLIDIMEAEFFILSLQKGSEGYQEESTKHKTSLMCAHSKARKAISQIQRELVKAARSLVPDHRSIFTRAVSSIGSLVKILQVNRQQ